MKLTQIAAAVATTLVCGLAAAAPHNTLPVSGTEMYFSGSTAADPLFRTFMAKNCDNNTLDAYRADTSTGVTQYVYVCTSSTGFGGTGGPTGNIIVHKSGTSSSDGVTPIANQTTLAYMSQSDIVAHQSAFTETDVPAQGVVNAYHSFQTAVGAIVPVAKNQPDVGVSDVEPKFFAANTVTSKLSSVNDYQLIFGVMATKVARNALQAAQGLQSGSDSLANMPSLSRADLASIYQGVATDLSLFDAASAPIYIGRRSSGSGTTKTFDLTFVNNACGAQASLAPATNSAGSASCTGANGAVIQMGTSEDMEACMNNFNTHGIAAFGEISTDYQPASGDGWRFIRIDGYAPANLNTVEGRYPLWAEGTLNVLAAAPPSGAKASILNTLKNETKNPTTLNAINAGLTQPLEGYNAGFLVLATAGDSYSTFPLTAAEVTTTPIANFTHNGDSCSFPSSAAGSDPENTTTSPVSGPNGFAPE